MCGIAGRLEFAPESNFRIGNSVITMLKKLAHRGHDGAGLCGCLGDKCQTLYGKNCDELTTQLQTTQPFEVVLGHIRLAIIDVAHGVQPITNESNTIAVVCNGEIYNYQELRAELESQGHQFKTASDSEVILHLYEADPAGYVSRLQGMFVYAIYDAKKRKLELGRDRAGQKPLFYLNQPEGFSFASEFGAFEGFSLTINEHSVQQFFNLQYIPAPATIYREVNQLEPGCTLSYDFANQSVEVKRYWQYNCSSKSKKSLAESAVELRELLSRSVKKRLISEVPLGGFLSGGIDSAIVAALMLEHSTQPITLYSIGFEESAYDESDSIKATVDFLKQRYPNRVNWELKKIDSFSFKMLEEVAAFYGQPFGDASMLPLYCLSRFAKESLSVTLSGDGADELFGGYERYVAVDLAQKLSLFLPIFKVAKAVLGEGGERSFAGRISRLARVVSTPKERRYYEVFSHVFSPELSTIAGDKMRASRVEPCGDFANLMSSYTAKNRAEQCAEHDFNNYMSGDVLTKVDIGSMRCALEVRSPFLDHEVMEFAGQLPWHFKQRGFQRKLILKRAFGDLLPPDILNRKKKGFGVPIASLLRGAWREEAWATLIDGEAIKQGWFKAEGVRQIWQKHLSEEADYSYLLLSAIVFELFLRRTNCQNP